MASRSAAGSALSAGEPHVQHLANAHLVGAHAADHEEAMTAYILKRILLMLPTLFGVVLVTFIVTQFVPGGPVEQFIAEAKKADRGGEGSTYRGGQGVDPKKIAEIKKLYGFDRPPTERFMKMLGQFARFDLGR